MITQVIPLEATPAQRINLLINNQNITISLYLADNNVSMYCDVWVGAVQVMAGFPCITGVTLNQYYTSFVGYLTWVTIDGLDPKWQDIGANALLLYSDEPISDLMYDKYVAENLIPLKNEFGYY